MITNFFYGFLVTISISLIVFILSCVCGFLLEVLRRKFSFRIIDFYVDFFRSVPLLILLYLVYFGLPSLNISLDSISCGIICMILYFSSYFSEIFRMGFNNIQKSQIDAAYALGFSSFQGFYYIHSFEFFRFLIPSIFNQFIIIVKDSSILSILSISELTFVTTKMMNENFEVFPYLVISAILYWILSEFISCLSKFFQRFFFKSQEYIE